MLHIIYTTVPDAAAAEGLARELVAQELAACVNVMAPHQSFYMWNGELTESTEVALWCKMPAHLVERASAFIRTHHPYETPCIMAWPASHCDPGYSAWASHVTQGPYSCKSVKKTD